MATTPDGTPFVEPGDAISAYPVVSQELAAVIDSLRSMIPAGAIFPYAGKTAPEGYLMCDGKAYNRSDFFDLYDVMTEWVLQWGGFPNGGDTSLFYVPDFRGRSPIGTAAFHGGSHVYPELAVVRDVDLGQRLGDHRIGAHTHSIRSAVDDARQVFAAGSNFGPVNAWITGPYNNSGPQAESGKPLEAYSNSGSPAQFTAYGTGHNYQPSTGVNFIVWTATTTTGKNPVPGVELAPVTTRAIIQARLEEAGIGEEEIEMLREQLAALKEDTDG